jgi:hypothetical protein
MSPQYPGPTANLPGYVRRSGRSGTVWINGRMRGEVTQVDWNVNVAQIPVLISGSWRTDQKPGGEERVGTFSFQDIDDHFSLQVYKFVVARRNGDRSAAYFPEFSIQTKLDDIGAPAPTVWQLDGCSLFSYTGGFDQAQDLLQRQIPFSFREETPIEAYTYEDGGIQIFNG